MQSTEFATDAIRSFLLGRDFDNPRKDANVRYDHLKLQTQLEEYAAAYNAEMVTLYYADRPHVPDTAAE